MEISNDIICLLTIPQLYGIIYNVEDVGRFSLSHYISLPKRLASSTNAQTNWKADIFMGSSMDTKICSKCGIEKSLDCFSKKRNGKAAECKQCWSIRAKLYRQRPDVRQSRYEYNKAYRQSNEQYREQQKEYSRNRRLQPDVIAHTKEYNQSDTCKDNRRKYMRSPKGQVVDARCQHRRRALIKELPCDLTAEQWEEIKLSQDYKCAMCGEVKPLQKDHIIPVTKGGAFTKSNIQGLCKSCNGSKQAKIIEGG
jgi:5-methylcytosine-specific restriction endonuclease McrA